MRELSLELESLITLSAIPEVLTGHVGWPSKEPIGTGAVHRRLRLL